jgi:tryptophan synthase alpha chain
MNRIAERFEQLRHQNSKALVTFITAGDPDLATTEAMIHLLEEAGTDIIELGMPFSDPMADGPTIQLATERPWRQDHVAGNLHCVRNVRTKSKISTGTEWVTSTRSSLRL